jgi:hypothetical protein
MCVLPNHCKFNLSLINPKVSSATVQSTMQSTNRSPPPQTTQQNENKQTNQINLKTY